VLEEYDAGGNVCLGNHHPQVVRDARGALSTPRGGGGWRARARGRSGMMRWRLRLPSVLALALLALPAAAVAQTPAPLPPTPTPPPPRAPARPPREPLPPPPGIRPFATPQELVGREIGLEEAVNIGLENAPLIVARIGDYVAAQQRVNQALA